MTPETSPEIDITRIRDLLERARALAAQGVLSYERFEATTRVVLDLLDGKEMPPDPRLGPRPAPKTTPERRRLSFHAIDGGAA